MTSGHVNIQEAERDSLEILQMLQKWGAKFKSSGKVGHLFGNSQPTLAIVRFMVKEMGLNPMQNGNNAEECPIRMVAETGKKPEVMAYMLQHGRISKFRRETLCVDTLNRGNDDMLEFLCKHRFTPRSLRWLDFSDSWEPV